MVEPAPKRRDEVSDCWKLLQSRELTDLGLFRVRVDRYQLEPQGGQKDFIVLQTPDWVNVVPVTEDGLLVLVKQFRQGPREWTLEVPGGVVNPGESPQDAALRELREETGFVPARVTSLGKVRPNPAFMDNWCYMYAAEGCKKLAEPQPDPFEQIETILCPVEEIPDLIRHGKICHGLVLNALAWMGLVPPAV